MSTTSPLKVGKECFLNAMGRVLVIEILGISGDSIWVSYPTADIIKEGTGVELSFHENDGFIGFHARVASGPNMNQSGIMLERAESARHNKERKNWRVPADFPVIIKKYDEEEQHEGVLKDITIDGGLVKTQDVFQAGSMLDIKMQLPEAREALNFLAQIVYSDPTTSDQQNRYGLRFVEVPAKGKKELMWFLYKKIHELYPRQLRELYPRPSKRTPA
jgi:hypothetical protein